MNDLTMLQAVCNELLKSQKSMLFFGLFMPEESSGDWDLVISAKGLGNDAASYEKVVSLLDRHLSAQERVKISRVTLIDPKDPTLKAFRDSIPRLIPGKSPVRELHNVDFGGTRIKRAIVLLASQAYTATLRVVPKGSILVLGVRRKSVIEIQPGTSTLSPSPFPISGEHHLTLRTESRDPRPGET